MKNNYSEKDILFIKKEVDEKIKTLSMLDNSYLKYDSTTLIDNFLKGNFSTFSIIENCTMNWKGEKVIDYKFSTNSKKEGNMPQFNNFSDLQKFSMQGNEKQIHTQQVPCELSQNGNGNFVQDVSTSQQVVQKESFGFAQDACDNDNNDNNACDNNAMSTAIPTNPNKVEFEVGAFHCIVKAFPSKKHPNSAIVDCVISNEETDILHKKYRVSLDKNIQLIKEEAVAMVTQSAVAIGDMFNFAINLDEDEGVVTASFNPSIEKENSLSEFFPKMKEPLSVVLDLTKPNDIANLVLSLKNVCKDIFEIIHDKNLFIWVIDFGTKKPTKFLGTSAMPEFKGGLMLVNSKYTNIKALNSSSIVTIVANPIPDNDLQEVKNAIFASV